MSVPGSRVAPVGRRITSIVSVAAMVMALLTAVGVQSAAAAGTGSTLQVCSSGCTYSTIQAAVDASNAAGGDTVAVQPGTYAEAVTVNHPVTISGANAGVDPTGSAARGAEAVVDPASGVPFTVTASGVTIDGFTVTAPANQVAIAMNSATSGETIQNNIINVGSGTSGAVSYDTSNTTISKNLVDFAGGGTPGARGIQKNSSAVTDITVSDNSFKGDATNVDALINVIPGLAPSGCPTDDAVHVTGNTSTTTGEGTFISVQCSKNVTISGNTTSTMSGSVIFMDAVQSVTVSGNDISNASGKAISITNQFGYGTSSGVTVLDNQLVNNGIGINVGGTGSATVLTDTLTATNNWWGSVGGPTSSSIAGHGATVTYSPWCADAACGTTTDSAPATRYVGATNASDTNNDCSVEASPCATIQHAIDVAMPGDIVQVAAGTYNGLVSITKPIILKGAGEASTTIDGTALANDKGIVSVGAVSPAGDVSVSGFTIQASTTATDTTLGASYVVVLQNTNGANTITLDHDTFQGVLPSGTTTVPNDALGIVSHTVAGTTTTISNSTFTGVNQGILLEHSGPTTLTDNVFSQLPTEVEGTTTWPAEGVLVLSDGGKANPALPQGLVTATGNTFQDYTGWGLMVRAGYVLPGCSDANPCPGSASVIFSNNTFALAGGIQPNTTNPTSAIFLEGTLDTSTLTATLSGNTGYVTAPGVPVDVVKDNASATVTVTGTGNAITSGPNATTNDLTLGFTPPTTVYAIGQAQAFTGFVNNASTADVPNVRYKVQLTVPTGMNPNQLKLTYSDGTATDTATFLPESTGSNVWDAYLKPAFTLPHGNYTMDLTITVAAGAPAGTLSAKVWLVQTDPTGTSVVNTLAGPVEGTSTLASSTVAECTTPTTEAPLTADQFNFEQGKGGSVTDDSATRSAGFYAFTATGLQLWTAKTQVTEPDPHSTTGGMRNANKVAAYTPVNIKLKDLLGNPVMASTNESGSLAGINIYLDATADGGPKGYLANVPGGGWTNAANTWFSTNVAFGVHDVPTNGYPGYESWGTLAEYLTRWPDAVVTLVGFTLGSGSVGSDLVTSLTYQCQTHALAETPKGSISGTVTDSAAPTAHPLQGVSVTASVTGYDGTTLATGTATTAADGTYTITGLPASNSYTVSFNPAGVAGNPATGFQAQDYVAAGATGTSSLVTVPSNGDAANISAKLAPLGGIGGTVKTSSGTPLAGVTVTATLTGSSAAPVTATTDSTGAYSITDLTTGSYAVAFSRPGYNGVTAPSTSVTDGSVTTVNISLAQAANSITGVVTDPTNNHVIVGARVTLKDATGLTWVTGTSASPVVNPTFTDGNGTYSFGNVPAGTYVVCFYNAGDVAGCSPSQTLYDGSSLTVNGTLTANPGSTTTAYFDGHPGWSNDPDPAGKSVAPQYVTDTQTGHTGSGAINLVGGPAVDYYHAVANLPLDQVSELSLNQKFAAASQGLAVQLRIYGANEFGTTCTTSPTIAANNGFSTLNWLMPAAEQTGKWTSESLNLASAKFQSTRAICGLAAWDGTGQTLAQITQNNPQAVVVMYGVFSGSTNGVTIPKTDVAEVDDISFNGNVTDFDNVSAGTTQITSTTSDTKGWVSDNTAPTYVFGPAGADGVGSLQISVAGTTGHVSWFHSVDPSDNSFQMGTTPTTNPPTTPLMGVAGLGFKVHVPAGDLYPSFQLRIIGANAPGSTGLEGSTGYAALNWEPAYNGTLPTPDSNGWITLSQLENGQWWSTRSINGLPNVQSSTATLAEIAIANPQAQIYAYGVNLGSGATASTDNVDDVTFNGTTTNFEPDVATISGTVTGGSPAAPLSGVAVTVQDTTSHQWAGVPSSVTTAADGTYSVTGLPAGTYQLCFVKAGYTASCQSETVTTPSTTTLDMQLAASPASTTTSTPMVPNGWWNDPDGTVAPAYVTVAGALGVGALNLHTTTGSTSADRAISYYHLANPADTQPGPTAAGVPLSQITEAGLSQNTGTDATYATVYQLRVYGATAASGSGEAASNGWTTLSWFPSTLASGWNAEPIDLATAQWGSSRAINGLSAGYGNKLTMSQIVAANPNARVVSYGVFRGSTSGGYPDDDSFVDGVSFNGVTTNFEPIVVPAATHDVATVTAPSGWANDPGGTVAPRYVVGSLSQDGDGALNLHVAQKDPTNPNQDPNTYASSYYHAANAADPAAGLPLSQISEMGFQQNAGNAAYPTVYQLRICASGIDTSGACTGFSTLNWTGDAVTAGTWQTESIDPVTATWWASRGIGGLAGGESATATLPQIIANNPSAVVMAYGVFRGSTAGNYPTGDGYVDNVSFNGHTTDFKAIDLTPSCAAPNAFASLQPSAWDFSQTRANGHYQFLADGGLKIYTDGSGDTGSNGTGGTWNTDKVAGYVAVNDMPLADLGQMLLSYTPDGTATATAPGYNLWLDNGVGTAGSNTGGNISGYITNEPTVPGSGYGDNWWSNTDFQVGAVGGGGSSTSNAPLQAYLNRWPNAFVTQYGFSLGSGIHGSGVLSSLSFGCDVDYPMPADSTVTSTPLVTNGWAPDPDGTVGPRFVTKDNPPAGLGTGSLDLHVNATADDGGNANTHAASYYHAAGSIPLTEAQSMGYSENLGSTAAAYRSVYQLRINGATGGGTDGFSTLVWVPTGGTDAGHGWTTYSIDPATALWVSTRAIAGLGAGQAGPGKTLAQIQAANPNATITEYGVFRGSTDGNYPTGDVDVDGVLFNYSTANFEPLGSSAANPITSTPSAPNGWAKDPASNVTAPSYVVNPNGVTETGHTGVGSLDLQLSSATNLTSYFRAANQADPAAGVPLGDITDMGFNTKTTTGDLPVYQLIVCGSISGDNPANCNGYTTLVWSPSITTGAGWQDVTIDPATSQWWSTRALGSLAASATTTLPQIIATNPNAVVVAYGVFRGSSTATYTSTTDSYVDDVDFNGTVTDFEPDTNKVTGTVTNSITGDPISGATVTLTIAGGTVPAATETTAADGTYSAAGLPAGTYTATFSATGYAGSQSSGIAITGAAAGTANAALTPAHLPTLDIALPATILVGASPVTFTGTVTNPAGGVDYSHVRYDITIDGPATLQASQLTLQYQAGGSWLPVPLSGTGTITGYFGPQGGFPLAADTAATTPLRISAAAGAPIGNVTVTTTLDGVDPTSHAVIGTAATSTEHTQIVSTGTIAGTITAAASGDKIAGATVTVVASDGTVAGSAVTGTSGAYSISSLLPLASYTVCVVADGYQTQCLDGSSAVAVGSGQTVTKDFALTALATSSNVSRPSTLNGWQNDPDNAAPTYVVNPTYQPEAGHTGIGSLSMDISVKPSVSWGHATTGVPLGDLSQLSYAQQGAGSVAYELLLCGTSSADNTVTSCPGYTRLVWQGPAATSTWGTVSVDLGTAQFWTTRALTGLAAYGPSATLAQIVANNPNAVIAGYGLFRGSTTGATSTDQMLVDDISFDGTTTDFEPDVVSTTLSAVNDDQAVSPLASVSLTVKTASGTVLYSVSGNTSSVHSDGTATVTTPDVPVGDYQVCITGTAADSNLLIPSDGNTCDTVSVTLAGPNTFTVHLKQERGSISGTVTGGGSPLSGASVTVKDASGATVATTTTGADGTYAVVNLFAGTYSVVVTDSPAWVSVTDSGVVVAQGAATVADATLPAAPGSIAGTVTDPAGHGVGGATVTVKDAGGATVGTATTAPDGSYTVSGIAAGTYDVAVADGAQWTTAAVPGVTVAQGKATTGVDATLSGLIAGSVVDSANAPVAHATVTVLSATGATAGTATTATDGSYTVTGLAPGTYTVCVAADGYLSQCFLRAAANVTVPSAAALAVGFTLTPVTATSLVSTPSAENGWAGDTPDTAEPSYVVNPSYTTEPGHTGVGSLSMDLTAQSSSSWWHAVSAPAGVRLDAVSQVGFNESLTGTDGVAYELVVCNTTSGDNAAQDCPGYTRLVWTPANPSSSAWTPVSADLATAQWWPTRNLTGQPKYATLTLAQIFANNPNATVIAYGVFRGTTGGTLTSDKALVDDVAFNGTVTDFEPDTATVTLSATNQDQSLSPLASVSLTVKTTSGTVLYSVTDNTSSVNPDGTATVTQPDVPVGSYQVCITGTAQDGNALVPVDGNTCDSVTVTLAGPNTFTVDLHQVKGSIAGTVTDAAGGAPISGVSVTVKDSSGATAGTATTGSDGTYTVSGVPAGTYSVVFTDAPTYAAKTVTGVVVVAGVPTTGVDAALTANAGSIAGTVTDSGSAGVKGVMVTAYGATSGAPVAASVATAADGTYTIPGVAAGSYVVCFDAAGATGGSSTTGYVSTCSSAQTVAAGAATTVNQKLAAAPAGASCDPGALTDVTSFWCKDVTWLLQHQITKGATPTTYDGAANVKRGQMALFLFRLANPGANDPICTSPSKFVDVNQSSSACGAITWLVDNHITTGTDATHFSPAASVTRGQMALFLYRETHAGANAPACGPTTSPFVDVPASALACGAIAWAFHAGVTTGVDATHFNPAGTVTRYQMAGFLHRAYDLTALSGTVTAASGPAAKVSVVITGTGSTTASYSAVTGSDGTYSVPGIDAGTYTVCFDGSQASGGPWALQCFDGKVGSAAPTTVTVTRWNGTVADATLKTPQL